MGGVYLGVGCLPGGGCLPRGGTPPSCGQADACENIIFLQLLLRTVKTVTLATSGVDCVRFS